MFLSKAYNVSVIKFQRIYVSWHWMQNLKENWLVAWKMTRNLVNFHVSCRKSENLHFDQILLSKTYKDLYEKIQKSYVSWHWRVVQSLQKNWLLVSNMTWGFWWIFNQPLKSPKIPLRWVILSKVYEVWTKKIQRNYLSWHWTVMQNLNNGMRNWVNFH